MGQAIATKPLTIIRLLVLTVASLLAQTFIYIVHFSYVAIALESLPAEELSGHVSKPMGFKTFIPLMFVSFAVIVAAGYLFKKSYFRLSKTKAEADYGYVYSCMVGCLIQATAWIFFFIYSYGDSKWAIVNSAPFWLMFFLSVQAYIKIRKNKQATA